MFFNKVNMGFDLPVEESVDVSSDLVSIANEIELECAMYNFETVHEAVETYHAVMEEDTNSGGDEKSRFQKFKDKMGAAKDKFIAFLKRIWQHIKDLFTKVIYWISTKISSNKDFAAKYEKENLGKVKVKYDYTESFKNMAAAQPKLMGIGDSYMKEFEDKANRKAIGSDVRNNEVDAKAFDELTLEVYNGELPFAKANSVGEIKETFRKAILIEKEEEVDGKTLLNILKSNAPTVEGFKKFNVGIMNFFKAIEGQVKKPDGGISVKIGLNPIYKVLSLVSSLVSTNIVCAQKLILAIRSDIKRSKGGSSSSSDKPAEGGAEAKPAEKAEGKTESAYFGGMIDSLI